MAIVTSVAPKLTEAKDYFIGVWSEKLANFNPASELTKVYATDNNKGRYHRFTEVTGFGQFNKGATELDKVAEDTIFKGYDVEQEADSYSLGCLISRQMIDYEMQGVMDQKMTFLQNAANETLGVNASAQLALGFTTVTSDGQYFFDTDHPYLDGSGSTQSNKLASNATLSVSSLNQAVTQMTYIRDGRGKRMMIKPGFLVVPPALEETAKKIILGTSAGYEPGSGNFTRNIAPDYGLKLIVDPWAASATAWMLIAEPKTPANHPLVFINSVPIEIMTPSIKDDYSGGALWISAYMRHKFIYNGWRGAFGSTGA